jgi:hypothetical protein
VRASVLNPFHNVRAEARRVIGANLSSLSLPNAVALYGAWVGSVTKPICLKNFAGNKVGTSPMRKMVVYLPAGYDDSSKHYPVIYIPVVENVLKMRS